MEKKVLFFDFGGVLVSPQPAPVEQIVHILYARGYSHDVVERVEQQAGAAWAALPASAGWISTWAEEERVMAGYYASIAEALPNPPVEMAAELAWLCHSMHYTHLYPDVIAGLEMLRARYRLAIISNALPSTDWIIDRLDIRLYFEQIILSAHVGCAKPEERIYQLALDAMQVQAQESIFIDDQIANVRMAQKLGMQGLHFVRSQAIGDVHDFAGLAWALKV